MVVDGDGLFDVCERAVFLCVGDVVALDEVLESVVWLFWVCEACEA